MRTRCLWFHKITTSILRWNFITICSAWDGALAVKEYTWRAYEDTYTVTPCWFQDKLPTIPSNVIINHDTLSPDSRTLTEIKSKENEKTISSYKLGYRLQQGLSSVYCTWECQIVYCLLWFPSTVCYSEIDIVYLYFAEWNSATTGTEFCLQKF